MSLFRKTASGLKRYLAQPCLDGLLWAFVALLLMVLAAQLVFIWAMATDQRLPLPEFAVTWVEDQAEADLGGLQLDIGAILATPDFRFFVSDIRLHSGAPNQPLASVASFNIGLDLSGILSGQIRPESFLLDQGALFCPAILSPTGIREQVISGISIAARQEEKRLSLVRGRMAALDIPITLSGSWLFPLLPGRDNGSTGIQASSPALMLGIGLRQMLAFRNSLGDLDRPHATLHFRQDPDEPPRLDFYTEAARISLPGYGLAEHPKLTATLEWKQGWNWSRPLTLQADRLSLPLHADTEVRGLTLQTVPPLSGGLNLDDWIPEFFDLHARGVSSRFGSTGPIFSTLRNRGFPRFSLEGGVRILDMPVVVSGQTDALTRDARIQIAGRRLDRERLSSLLAPFGLEPPPDLRRLEESNWTLNLNLRSGRPETLSAQMETGPVTFRDCAFLALRLDGAYDWKTREAALGYYGGEIDDGHFHGSGSYHLDSRELDVHVALSNILPSRLNSLFPDWWDRIWPDFEFHGRLPQADFHISNTLGWRHRLSFFGNAQVWDAVFKGVEIAEASARIAGRPSITEIFDLDARRPEGRTTGSISWVYWHTEKPGLKATRWDVDSTFDPAAARSMFSNDVQQVFDDFTPSGPTHIRSAGVLFSSKSAADLKDRDTVNVFGKTEHGLKYRGYPFQSLTFDSRIRPGRIEISVTEAGFAGGSLSGDLSLSGPRGNKNLNLDLRLQEAREKEILPVLAKFKENADDANPESAPETGGRNPLINLDLVASGPVGDVFGFQGSGNLQIEDPLLANIPVFGALSRVLKKTPLPLGNLSLTRLASPFTLEGNRIAFSEMEISGPITRIRASGDVQLPENELDFRVVLIPGNPEESEFFSAVTSVFRPLSYALELDLRGKLSDPKWRFRNNPVNMFFPDPEPIPRAPESRVPPPASETESASSPPVSDPIEPPEAYPPQP